jgi:hypothetical protein
MQEESENEFKGNNYLMSDDEEEGRYFIMLVNGEWVILQSWS